jgi:hypothetical protein
MKRRYFKLPSRDFFEAMTDRDYRRERASIIRRTRFVYRLFGPPRGMLFSGTMTADLYFEMINSYINGLYLGTIFTSHALIESTLAFGYILSSQDAVAEGGLGKIVTESRKNNHISQPLCNRLDELRRMRIAYFHSHVGLNKRGAMKRYLDSKLHGHRLHKNDAETALTIVFEYLEETSPAFFSSRQ